MIVWIQNIFSILLKGSMRITTVSGSWQIRIYRDVRFSSDKRPYKDHIGIILAPHGGRKSHYGCYYLHLQPGESMFAAGMWNPESELIKALRRDIYDNYDELEENKFLNYTLESMYC